MTPDPFPTGRSGALPPGQRPLGRLPRFGVDLSRPARAVPPHPGVVVRGAVAEPADVPLAEVLALPRRVLTADLHCVAGWSALGLTWEGVSFRDFWATVVGPRLLPSAPATHVLLRGLDGYRAVLLLEDALADDVLLADRLDGQPLDPDHGAPLRLVSPRQYGYLSVKQLCSVEVHLSEPRPRHPLALRLLSPHPRARVALEERHRHLPGRLLRPAYRQTVAPLLRRSERGSRPR